MSIVTFRLDKNSERKIDEKIQKHGYNTKTEFIREAIRDKIRNLERNELIIKTYGASKRKTNDEQLHKAREKIVQDLLKEL